MSVAAVIELTDVPAIATGAPMPVLLHTELRCQLAYICRSDEVCVVTFRTAYASYLGSPNDETLHGHRLYAAGLRHYAAFEVRNSDWIASLEKMNRVHSSHEPEAYADLRHFIWSFHDSTFECVAKGYTCAVIDDPLAVVVERMASRTEIG